MLHLPATQHSFPVSHVPPQVQHPWVSTAFALTGPRSCPVTAEGTEAGDREGPAAFAHRPICSTHLGSHLERTHPFPPQVPWRDLSKESLWLLARLQRALWVSFKIVCGSVSEWYCKISQTIKNISIKKHQKLKNVRWDELTYSMLLWLIHCINFRELEV